MYAPEGCRSASVRPPAVQSRHPCADALRLPVSRRSDSPKNHNSLLYAYGGCIPPSHIEALKTEFPVGSGQAHPPEIQHQLARLKQTCSLPQLPVIPAQINLSDSEDPAAGCHLNGQLHPQPETDPDHQKHLFPALQPGHCPPLRWTVHPHRQETGHPLALPRHSTGLYADEGLSPIECRSDYRLHHSSFHHDDAGQ